eukprot:scaffold86507_cov24-Tisochrysis_lutea.AAC.4
MHALDAQSQHTRVQGRDEQPQAPRPAPCPSQPVTHARVPHRRLRCSTTPPSACARGTPSTCRSKKTIPD